MQKIAFTLCSNNYLAQAKTLGDSFISHNSDFIFIIGLVDKFSESVDYSFFKPHTIISVEDIKITDNESMLELYNIIEYNTAVKPFYFEYLFSTYKDSSHIYYIDPDIVVYSSFKDIDGKLKENNFVLTPHITNPMLEINDFETVFLNVGIYNLGFIGISRSEHSFFFLQWWKERMKSHCKIDYGKGLFVDQIWINFITILFNKVFVIKSPGYNMACWNFQEREILKFDGEYYVNSREFPLVFYHFSGFNIEDREKLSKLENPSLTFRARPDLAEIYNDYVSMLMKNDYEHLSKIEPLLNFQSSKSPVYSIRQRVGFSLRKRVNNTLNYIFKI